MNWEASARVAPKIEDAQANGECIEGGSYNTHYPVLPRSGLNDGKHRSVKDRA